MHLARFRPRRTSRPTGGGVEAPAEGPDGGPGVPARRRTGRRRIVAGAVALVALAGVAGVSAGFADHPAPVRSVNRFMTMPETPGSARTVRIDTSFFTPVGGGRHPAVLLAHGFGGSKDDMADQARQLARDGFAVLTWSSRGFGRSTGAIGLDAPDREVADVRRLVDWLGHRPDVVQDGPDDPRVGVAGASYGGAISLLAAGYDKRIDAIAPQITWWNLADALFPQNAQGEPADSGVFKKLWAGIFFTTGSTGAPTGAGAGGQAPGAPNPAGPSTATGGSGQAAGPASTLGSGGGSASATGRAPSDCRFTAQLCAVYRRAAVSGHADAATVALLDRSSPSSVGDRIKVPTLVVQGQNDSLFPLGQGDAMARTIAANGAPVTVDWMSGGHDGGDQEDSRVEGRIRDWFDHYLKGERNGTGPAFRVTRPGGVDTTTGQALQRGATDSDYPGLAGTTDVAVRLTGGQQRVDNPAGGSPPAVSAVPGIGALSQLAGAGQGLAVDFPGQAAFFDSAPLRAPLTVTGSPRVRITVASDAPDGQAVLFGKVYDVGPDGRQTLPHQLVAPLRVTGAGGAGRAVTVTLPAVDHQFSAGHRLRLVLSATDLGYASPVDPAAYRVGPAAGAVALSVPTVPGLAGAPPGMPVWTWALPLAVVLVSAALLLTGRRRRAAPAEGGGDLELRMPGARSAREAEVAGDAVPLEITGLSKRYRGAADRYAVRELSFRVERGQVLGLLGPNGAGKTTTMRMLMGLITPDAGQIRIFGRRVGAGAAVLSRVGAFVEGAGFLPHLTGRANLDLYWRATGRPAEDAHLAEALEIADLGEALDRAVRTYSQGMRQRLAIAQAMLGLPDLLILDEPTNGLDPPQIREMRAVVTRYAASGRTVIVSSHLLSEVEQSCTHLVVMDKGRLVAAGPVGEIIGSGETLFVGAPTLSKSELEDTAAALTGVPGVVTAEAAEEGVLVRLDGPRVPELLAELLRLGVPVERVGPHRRLEDAFLTLIGGPA